MDHAKIKLQIIVDNIMQKIINRAESPAINSVGHRPTKRYAYTNPKPQRGVIRISPFQGLGCECHSQNRALPYPIDYKAFSLNCHNQLHY